MNSLQNPRSGSSFLVTALRPGIGATVAKALADQGSLVAVRTETALSLLRELKQELEGLGTTDEKIAAVNVRLAETTAQLDALRNPDGSNVAAIEDTLEAATEIWLTRSSPI